MRPSPHTRVTSRHVTLGGCDRHQCQRGLEFPYSGNPFIGEAGPVSWWQPVRPPMGVGPHINPGGIAIELLSLRGARPCGMPLS